MNRIFRLVSVAVLVLAGGCGVSTSPLEDELVGAWYGEGPDGDQCFVFCGDGRLFTGDRPCTDSTASDFDTSSSVTFGETSFSITFEETVTFTGVSVSDDTMTYEVLGGSYQAPRTAVPDYCSTRP